MTLEDSENAASFVRLGLPFILIIMMQRNANENAASLHTNASRKQSFSKMLFEPDLKMPALRLMRTGILLKTDRFESDGIILVVVVVVTQGACHFRNKYYISKLERALWLVNLAGRTLLHGSLKFKVAFVTNLLPVDRDRAYGIRSSKNLVFGGKVFDALF